MADDVPCQYSEKMKMNSSLGVNLRVTGHCNQGDRKYMEDMFCVAYQQTEDGEDLEYAYFGIFDGHGGKEAAVFARERLMEFIVNEKKFWSDNDEDVLSAIRGGYIATHYAMWKELANWPKTASGLPSTSGTTATIAFIRNGKIYTGHVGDSSLVLGYQAHPGPPHEHGWLANPLTHDHKPESLNEIRRIQRSGGKVKSKSGVPRVVWNRPRIGHKGPVRRSTPIDEIPFLAVARSLGDLWSYNSDSNQFVVSPEPDVRVLKIDTSLHRCLIFGTDGFWNMVNPLEAVLVAQEAEKHNEAQAQLSPSEDPQSCETMWINPSKRLVDRALRRWNSFSMRADNTSVVTLLLNPPCSQGMCQTQKIVSHNSEQVCNPARGLPSDSPCQSTRDLPTEESAQSCAGALPFEKVEKRLDSPASADSVSREGLQTELLSAAVQNVSSGDEDKKESCCPQSAESTSTGERSERECVTNELVEAPATSKVTAESDNIMRGPPTEQGTLSTPSLLERASSPSPISNPMAASTPAPAYPLSMGVSYPRSAIHMHSAKGKAVESVSRRGRVHPVKEGMSRAGPSDRKQGMRLSSNLETGLLLRGVKRRHSSVWVQRSAVSESKEIKNRTRSEDKSLQLAAMGTSDVKYNTEDTENERVAWPSDWLKKMRRCREDGSQENIGFSPRRRKKCMLGSPLSAIRQVRARASGHLFSERRESHSRTLRSDTNAALQCRTLRSRNVDMRSTMKMQLSASKLTPKRTVHLRAALSAELSSFAGSSSLLLSPRGTLTSTRRKTRAVPTRSRV